MSQVLFCKIVRSKKREALKPEKHYSTSCCPCPYLHLGTDDFFIAGLASSQGMNYGLSGKL
jgi:hypothetical protein